jgi:hypothetical protein
MHSRVVVCLLLLGTAATGCGADTSFVHEAALIGQFREARLGDNAADLHARWWDLHGRGTGDVVRQEFASKDVADRLSVPRTAQLRDVTEKNGIRVLFIERVEGETFGTVVIATTNTAEEVFDSDSAPLYDAVLTPDGFAIAVRDPEDGCVLRWLEDTGEIAQQVSLDATVCADGLQLVSGRPSNKVALTTGSVSGVVTSEGAVIWDGGGDLLTWAPLGDTLIVADKGDSELKAWFEDGEEAWYTDIGQSVDDLDSLGVAGTIALATSVGSGGRIVVLDAFTGNAVTATDIPVAAEALTAGSAGTHVALSFKRELHLFRVDPLAR